MYENSQLPSILATIARIRDLSDFEWVVSKEHRGFKVCVCVSVTRSEHLLEHLLENLEWRLRQSFPPPSTKHQIIEFLPPREFQTLVESMPRCIEAVLARGGPTTY